MGRRQIWKIVAFGLCLAGSVLVITGMLMQADGGTEGRALVYAGGVAISAAMVIYIVMSFSGK